MNSFYFVFEDALNVKSLLQSSLGGVILKNCKTHCKTLSRKELNIDSEKT